ncbi:aminotransferase class I/II-fold pyridoxal phosphate-dependent enzyme [Aggregatilineales bacterium SYSU G02658]
MPSIARRVQPFGTTIFAQINTLAARYGAVNLGQGRPDVDGPASIIEAAVDALTSGRGNQYPSGLGVLELREGIARHVEHFYGLKVDVESGVVVTNGAAEGVYSAVQGIVNEGDEVILIEPFFDTYLPSVINAGGVPVYVPMRPPQWTFDPDELRAAFNERTAAIILNTPHNPTGRVFTREELQLIADLCIAHDVVVISDEVYEHLTYDHHHHIPIATLPNMFERTLTISSGAKTFSFTGWKVGWVYGHPDLMTGVWRIHQNIVYAVNGPAQYGIAHALTLDDSYYNALRTSYNERRLQLLEALQASGLKPSTPEGAFYIMADFSEVFDGDDLAFAEFLIREVGVATIPPSSFFSDANRCIGSKSVRFSYCKQARVIDAAAERLLKLKSRV